MKIDFSKINWSLSDAENARRLGCHPATVNRIRKAAGIAPVNPKHPRAKIERTPRTNWKGVDWTKDNKTLAEILGVKVPTVSMRRAMHALGSGAPRGVQKRPQEWLAIAAKLSERKTVHQWLNGLEIPSEESGKPLCLLRRIRIALDRLNAMSWKNFVPQSPPSSPYPGDSVPVE